MTFAVRRVMPHLPLPQYPHFPKSLIHQLSRQHARNMEALASIREMKKSGGKGDDEIFMNFGDIFVAGKRGKVEAQLKVRAASSWYLCGHLT